MTLLCSFLAVHRLHTVASRYAFPITLETNDTRTFQLQTLEIPSVILKKGIISFFLKCLIVKDNETYVYVEEKTPHVTMNEFVAHTTT